MGSLPLILSTGAGSETRYVIGLVILFGVAMAGLLTLIIVPLAYRLFSRRTTGPQATAKKLEAALKAETSDRDKELTAHSSS
jgi:multidrug efflux pump